MSPKVSVTMPVFNRELYLRQAIDSVLAQTFQDFELLVLDDGSTDSSAAIIQSYRDPRLRLNTNPVNRGIRWCRKRLLESARGDYIAVLDSDDVAYPQRLQRQVEYLDTHAEAGLVASGYDILNENGTIIGAHTKWCTPLELRFRLLLGTGPVHSSTMFRRTLAVQLGGYNEHLNCGEDYDLFLRFARHSLIHVISQPLTQYREHPQGSYRAEDKSDMIRLVAENIYAQTGLTVNPIAIRYLVYGRLDSTLASTVNEPALREAYAAVIGCVKHFRAMPGIASDDVMRVRSHALEKIQKLAWLNPGFDSLAWGVAWRCIGVAALADKTACRLALKSLLFAALGQRWHHAHRQRNKQT